MENFYTTLKNVTTDPDTIYAKKFILQYYQVVPKYYFLTNSDIHTLVLNYSVGSGKTSAGCFCALDNVNTYKMFMFNKRLMPKNISSKSSTGVSKNVNIVGNWITTSAVCNELLRPEFHFITKDTYNKMNTYMNSASKEHRIEGELIRNNILKQINKYINFYGYQTLFNNCFPSLPANKYTQNAISLVSAYERGSIHINEQFLETLRNGIIIIDEMQKLYSIEGINTYGFAVMCIVKIAKKYNIKIIFLTGTLFNTSLSELPDIVNIVCGSKKIYKHDSCLEQVVLFDDIKTHVPTEIFKNECIKLLENIFMYYNQSKSTNASINYVPILEKYSNVLQALVFPIRVNLPKEVHIGNTVITDKGGNYKMILYSCETYGYQSDVYKNYVESHLNKNTLDEDDESSTSSVIIQDAAFPTASKMLLHGITHSDGIYYGKFMLIKNIQKYSTIGYNMYKLCLEHVYKNEKIIIYHNKLKNFGLYQYMSILQMNGFIEYGSNPKSTSICKQCHNIYEIHTKILEERISNKCCNHFVPMVYYKLIGEMNLKEREHITNNVYNSPSNLYGEQICVMFVSDVAYSGVSFLNTNNLIMLSRISNISKWKQIYARIVRTKSHSLLPSDKQYANIYTMVINYPNEKKIFKTNITLGEKYYKLRSMLNDRIDIFIDKLNKETVGNKLLETPGSMEISPKTNKRLNEIYANDIITEIDSVIDDVTATDVTSMWTFNTIIDRIKNNTISYSFANLSKIDDDILTSILLNKQQLQTFMYDANIRDNVFIQNRDVSTSVNEGQISSFTFDDMATINVNEKVFLTMVGKLELAHTKYEKIEILSKILRFVGKKYERLVYQEKIMEALYYIHDEYYEDDDINFFKNHITKNRNISKMAGFYYGEIIILRNGKPKQINYTFPDYTGWSDIPYKFKLSCLNLSSSALFYLHVNIASKQDNIRDMRKISKGIVCTSFNINEIKQYIPELNHEHDNKKLWCEELLEYVIEKQYENMDDRNVYTPFEK